MSRYVSWRVERVEETASTNDLARAHVLRRWEKGEATDAGGLRAFVAKQQTSGRGQHGRAWESPAGGLYLSAVVEIVPKYRGQLALMTGVAVGEALHNLLKLQAQLRWPNDVVLGGKKVGGILCEGVAQEQRWAGIVGIGINANVQVGDLPADVRGRATSVLEITGRPVGLEGLELSILGALSRVLKRVAEEGLAPVVEQFRHWDALAGHDLVIGVDDERVKGVGAGIDPQGHLLLRTEAGERVVERGTVLEIDGEVLRRA